MMAKMEALLAQIETGDTAAFKVKSQTTEKDKSTLLAVQNFVKEQVGTYSYIEIGSHLGGSLVPHLADPACELVSSIDLRPEMQRDERGRDVVYEGNSTDRMILGLMDHLPVENLTKLKTYDCDAADLDKYDVHKENSLALIDGEQTNTAAFRDFLNLRPFMAKNSVVLFHDSNLIFDALLNIESLLDHEGGRFRSFFLPGILYGIGFGDMARPSETALESIAIDHDTFVPRARSDLQKRLALHLKDA